MEIWAAEALSNPSLYWALITFLSSVWTQDSDCVHTESRVWRQEHSSSALVFLLLGKKNNDRKNQERKIDRKEERRKQGERRRREGRERGKERGREGGEMETNCQGRTAFLFPALLSEVFPSSEADVQHHVKVYLGRKHRLN